jgi:predicted MFS family arabinose efflux permease
MVMMAQKNGDPAELFVLLWAAAVATSFFSLAPTLVGAFMDELHLSARELGLISSGELAGSAVASLFVLVSGHLFSRRWMLTISLALVGIADLATAEAHDFTTILMCRVVSGLGGGLAFSAVTAAAARLPKCGLMFAAISIVQMVFGMLGFIGAPVVLRSCGLAGVFTILGGCSLTCALVAKFRVSRVPVHGSTLSTSLSLGPRGALVLSLFATFLTSTAVWTYLERIGVAARLTASLINMGLAIGMVSGVLGALGATVLLLRTRDLDEFLVGGSAVMAASTGLLLKASAPLAYLVALFGFNGALSLVAPLYQARLAAESGGDSRVLVAMVAMYLGLIGGPLLGAGLITGLGFEDLIHFAAALFLAAALMAFGAMRLSPRVVTS